MYKAGLLSPFQISLINATFVDVESIMQVILE